MMEYKTLNQISENLDARRRPITAKDRTKGEIPYYGASGVVDYVKEYIFDEDLLLVSEDGANLIMRSTPIAFSVSGKTWVNNHAHVLRFKDQHLQKYVEYYLNYLDLAPYITGTAQPKLNQQMLNKIQIPILNADRVADVVLTLKHIENTIRCREKQLRGLDELIKARFVEMFGDPKINEKCWDEGTIGDYFDVKGGKRIPKGMDYSDCITDHPYLRATDMKNETILDDDIHYISEEVFQHIKRYTVKSGDIYLTNVGVHLGMAGVIPERYNGANLTENAVKLVPKTDKFRGAFIANYINSPGIQDYINERKMAVGVPKLAIFRIESMPLIIPPLEKQDEFVAFRTQVDKSKVVIRRSLEETQVLFDSLMQQYFG